jgi:hypothetical protein
MIRRSGCTAIVRIIGTRRATRHEKASATTDDLEIPELKREQLGRGVRGKSPSASLSGPTSSCCARGSLKCSRPPRLSMTRSLATLGLPARQTC